MVDVLHLQNESFDLLINGSVIEAAVKNFEIAWTFGGVIWLWPILFLGTLILVAMKLDNPGFIAIYAILGNVALATRLPQISGPFLTIIVVMSIMIWLYSLFASPRLE